MTDDIQPSSAGLVLEGLSGKSYALQDGEDDFVTTGSLYHIIGQEGLVVVLLPDEQRTEKSKSTLESLINISPPSLATKQFSWPIDIVYIDGLFAGFVMTYMENGSPIDSVARNASSWNKRLRVAQNLCVAVDSMRRAGLKCGALYPSRILVNPETCRVFIADGIPFQQHQIMLSQTGLSRRGGYWEENLMLAANAFAILQDWNMFFRKSSAFCGLDTSGLYQVPVTRVLVANSLFGLEKKRGLWSSIRKAVNRCLRMIPGVSFEFPTVSLSSLPIGLRGSCRRWFFEAGYPSEDVCASLIKLLKRVERTPRFLLSRGGDWIRQVAKGAIGALHTLKAVFDVSIPESSSVQGFNRAVSFWLSSLTFSVCYGLCCMVNHSDVLGLFLARLLSERPVASIFIQLGAGYQWQYIVTALVGVILCNFFLIKGSRFRGYRRDSYLFSFFGAIVITFLVPVLSRLLFGGAL